MVGRHDLDRVQVLLLFQQLPEIGISGDAAEIVGGALLGIVAVDDVFAALASAGDGALGSGPPLGLADRAAKRRQQPVLIPVSVAGWMPVGIADADDLNLGRAKQRGD